MRSARRTPHSEPRAGFQFRARLGARIRRYREALGLSREAAARKSPKLSARNWTAVERGESWPGPETLAAIAKVLGVKVSELWAAETRSGRPTRPASS